MPSPAYVLKIFCGLSSAEKKANSPVEFPTFDPIGWTHMNGAIPFGVKFPIEQNAELAQSEGADLQGSEPWMTTAELADLIRKQLKGTVNGLVVTTHVVRPDGTWKFIPDDNDPFASPVLAVFDGSTDSLAKIYSANESTYAFFVYYVTAIPKEPIEFSFAVDLPALLPGQTATIVLRRSGFRQLLTRDLRVMPQDSSKENASDLGHLRELRHREGVGGPLVVGGSGEGTAPVLLIVESSLAKDANRFTAFRFAESGSGFVPEPIALPPGFTDTKNILSHYGLSGSPAGAGSAADGGPSTHDLVALRFDSPCNDVAYRAFFKAIEDSVLPPSAPSSTVGYLASLRAELLHVARAKLSRSKRATSGLASTSLAKANEEKASVCTLASVAQGFEELVVKHLGRSGWDLLEHAFVRYSIGALEPKGDISLRLGVRCPDSGYHFLWSEAVMKILKTVSKLNATNWVSFYRSLVWIEALFCESYRAAQYFEGKMLGSAAISTGCEWPHEKIQKVKDAHQGLGFDALNERHIAAMNKFLGP